MYDNIATLSYFWRAFFIDIFQIYLYIKDSVQEHCMGLINMLTGGTPTRSHVYTSKFILYHILLKQQLARWRWESCLVNNTRHYEILKNNIMYASVSSAHHYWCQIITASTAPKIYVMKVFCFNSSCVKTLRPRKIAAIADDIFNCIFREWKMSEFPLRFHRNLFLRVQLTTFQHWFR